MTQDLRTNVASPPRAGGALVLLVSITMLIPTSPCTAAAPTPRPHVTDVPAFTRDARILFQGDSITDGNRGRNADPNHILGHGYAFIIAARYGAALPERRLTFMNRGVSGNKVTDLAKRWQPDTIDLRPDVLSILIGVNDLSSNVPAEEYERRYDELLALMNRKLPDTTIVLCEPFGLPVGKRKDAWPTFGPALRERQGIVARLAERHGAILVRLQHVFDDGCTRAPADYWIWDGIHPTYAGHQLIADEWVRTVAQARTPTATKRPATTRPAAARAAGAGTGD